MRERKGVNSLRTFTVCNILLKYVGDKLSPLKSLGALSLAFLGEFHPLYFNFSKLQELMADIIFSFFSFPPILILNEMVLKWKSFINVGSFFVLPLAFFSIKVGVILICSLSV